MIKKTLILISYILISQFSFAMKKEKTFIISNDCRENIKKLRDDKIDLHDYFTNIFEQVARKGLPYKPSQLIKICKQHINEALSLQYMPASHYLEAINIDSDKLDIEFENQYLYLKNLSYTWAWFDKYFYQIYLLKPITDFKDQLIETDQKKFQLEEEGIFFYDETNL